MERAEPDPRHPERQTLMPIDPTRIGYYRVVRPDGTEVSKHNYPEEGYGVISGQPAGEYFVEPPRTRVVKTDDAPPPAPPVDPPPPDEEPPVDEPPVEEPPPPSGTNPFNALVPAGFKLSQLSADLVPFVTRPNKAAGVNDPFFDDTYGVPMYRAALASEGSEAHNRHEYSRRSPFSAGNRYFLTQDGNGSWRLYDGVTFDLIRVLPFLGGDCEPLWHPTNPKLLRHTAPYGGKVWWETDVETDARTVLFDFGGQTPWPQATAYWTKGEGNFSADGRYICLMATHYNASTQRVEMYGVLCLDVVEQRIVGTMTTSELPDHVSMSASGRYCVVSGRQTISYPRDFDASGVAGTLLAVKEEPGHKLQRAMSTADAMRMDAANEAVVDDFDEALATEHYRVLYERSEHSDIGFGEHGEDIIVHAVFTGANEGWIVATDMDTGAHTRCTRLYDDNHGSTTPHITAQCFDRPGVFFVSTYDDYYNYGIYPADPIQPLHRKVSMHRMDGTDARNVAHIHTDKSVGNAYFHEPQAAISRDGTRIALATAYGEPGHAEMFIIGLPDSVYDRQAA